VRFDSAFWTGKPLCRLLFLSLFGVYWSLGGLFQSDSITSMETSHWYAYLFCIQLTLALRILSNPCTHWQYKRPIFQTPFKTFHQRRDHNTPVTMFEPEAWNSYSRTTACMRKQPDQPDLVPLVPRTPSLQYYVILCSPQNC
jgi:hypothetical protein